MRSSCRLSSNAIYVVSIIGRARTNKTLDQNNDSGDITRLESNPTMGVGGDAKIPSPISPGGGGFISQHILPGTYFGQAWDRLVYQGRGVLAPFMSGAAVVPSPPRVAVHSYLEIPKNRCRSIPRIRSQRHSIPLTRRTRSVRLFCWHKRTTMP